MRRLICAKHSEHPVRPFLKSYHKKLTVCDFEQIHPDKYCPSISMMLRGDFDDVEMLENCLRNQIPVILVNEVGGLCGLICEFLDDQRNFEEKITDFISLEFLEKYQNLMATYKTAKECKYILKVKLLHLCLKIVR